MQISGLGFVGSQDRPIVVLDLELEAPNVNDVVRCGLPFLRGTPMLSHVEACPIGGSSHLLPVLLFEPNLQAAHPFLQGHPRLVPEIPTCRADVEPT